MEKVPIRIIRLQEHQKRLEDEIDELITDISLVKSGMSKKILNNLIDLKEKKLQNISISIYEERAAFKEKFGREPPKWRIETEK